MALSVYKCFIIIIITLLSPSIAARFTALQLLMLQFGYNLM